MMQWCSVLLAADTSGIRQMWLLKLAAACFRGSLLAPFEQSCLQSLAGSAATTDPLQSFLRSAIRELLIA